ncbi:MAG: type II CRISPR RNA-guided endonuclease Cas9 [Anaerolineaceae bacterium]
MKPEKYYLGLDMGSTSVGFAVTDPNYYLVKANRKCLWGVRLFDEANTAAKRRAARSSRRRRDREVLRLKLLQDLFGQAINRVDPAFFQRLNDSFFFPADKAIEQRFTLFNDPGFTDVDFHRSYPTIYHLRHALMTDPKPHDVRLVYLAVHHILKHRGHFLYEGQSGFELGSAFDQRFATLQKAASQTLDLELPAKAGKVLHEVLMDRRLKRADKVNEIMTQLGWDEKLQQDFVKLLLGYSIKLTNLLGEEYKDAKPESVSFDKAGFEDEKQEQYVSLLKDEEFAFLDSAYQFFGHMRLETLLLGHTSLSAAKIALYEKHKTDLTLIKTALGDVQFDDFFNKSVAGFNNYVAYTGHLRVKGKKQPVNYRCQPADFYEELKKQLNKLPQDQKADERIERILLDIDNSLFLPRQKSKDNSLIPNQLQMLELQAIFDNAERYLPFLTQPGAEGLTIREMIESLVSFRIPYFVGPLNPAHRVDRNNPNGSHHAWITKLSPEPVRPWNFSRVVDQTRSAMDFIANLTNKCSHLIGEDVLPKSSPTYSRYAILNLINVIAINGERLKPALKQKLFNDFFLTPNRREKLTRKSLLRWFPVNNYPDVKEENLTGMDLEIPGDLRAEILIESIAPEKLSRQEKDEIVRLLTILPDSYGMISDRLTSLFGQKLNATQIDKLSRLKFSGWGRLSAKLLDGITTVGPDGQIRTVLGMMWDFNFSLQEVLASQFGFKEQIDKLNREVMGTDKTLSYRVVRDYPTSPSVQKMSWQALKVVKELTGIMKRPPEKIFLEVAREEGKKERTTSRKRQLETLYKDAKLVDETLSKELSEFDEPHLRRKKIFLYFLQLGRCAYSGEPIDLGSIDGRDANGEDLYDLDHIYPRSLTKDDSIHNNLVLVKGILNREKSDAPLSPAIQAKQRVWWAMLKEKGLMNSEKYNRLTRAYPLSEDDLAGFISRQLVETRQATKAAADILRKVLPDTQVVFVKAGHVSDFRYHQDSFKFPKVRGMNDLHHAKDAYLNIVVGNVFNAKFTADPRNFIRNNPPRSYNLTRMYDFKVRGVGDSTVWEPGEAGTLATITKIMARNNILVSYQTRHPRSGQNGGLFDQMIKLKGQGQFPIKTSDPRLSSPEGMAKYGAYNKETGYSFFVVEHLQKKKTLRTIYPLPLSFALTQPHTEANLLRYCEEVLGLSQPKIIVRDLPYNSILRVNGFPLRLLAKTGSSLKFASYLQPIFPVEFEPLLKRLLKVEDETISEEQISSKRFEPGELLALYDALLNKISLPPYDRLGTFRAQVQNLEKGRECFEKLSPTEQQKTLRQMITLFQCDGRSSDLSLLLPKNDKNEASTTNKQVGTIKLAQNFQKEYSFELILQSPGGVFEQVLPLSTTDQNSQPGLM